MNVATANDVLMPPHNADAEISLLGSIVLYPSIIDQVDIEPEYFYSDQNRIVFDTLLTMVATGNDAIDAITLAESLQSRNRLSTVGGAAYIDEIVSSVPHAEHARYYANIVRKCWLRRSVIDRCRFIIQEAHFPDADIDEIRERAVSALTDQCRSKKHFVGKPAADLWSLSETPIEWLVESVFSCNQPTIFGAKQKSLKTTLLTDLAVSLASGFPWLGRFAVTQRRRVLFVTGESSEIAAIRKVRRAAESRNLRQSDLAGYLWIEAIEFPTLSSEPDCRSLQAAVREHAIDVVLIDPLYMGLSGLDTKNLTEVGPAMRQFMAHCRPANVIIAHHVKKTASFDDAPNLEDLSQAGIAEFAGNYWLMGRMSEYQGDGVHQLAIRYGGRDEQFGLLKLQFDERNWTADFEDLIAHREDVAVRRENERTNRHLESIKGHLRRHQGRASLAKLAEAAGTKVSRESFQRLVDEMCESGQYERCEVTGGNNRKCEGLCVKGQSTADSVL